MTGSYWKQSVAAVMLLITMSLGQGVVAADSKTTGRVIGKTVDAAGRANESVKVTVFDGDKPLGTAYSDSDGKFAVENLPAGKGYTVTAVRKVRITSLSGKKADVTVKAGETTDIGNVELGLGNPE